MGKQAWGGLSMQRLEPSICSTKHCEQLHGWSTSSLQWRSLAGLSQERLSELALQQALFRAGVPPSSALALARFCRFICIARATHSSTASAVQLKSTPAMKPAADDSGARECKGRQGPGEGRPWPVREGVLPSSSNHAVRDGQGQTAVSMGHFMTTQVE